MTNANPAIAIVQTPSDAVHLAMRFLRLMRANLWIIAVCVGGSGVIGLLYYMTATRIYRAEASLLVESTGPDGWNVNVTANQGADSLIPTQELLITKAVVLNRAAAEIRRMPAELQLDFEEAPFEKWPNVIRTNLSARGFRRTQIIDLSYRSKSPEAAEAVLGAVVDSYLTFMAENHRNVSVEMVNNLEKERRQIESKLAQKQTQLIDTRRRVRVLDVKEGSNLVHPAVQTAIELNQDLVKVQKERIRLQASLAAVRNAYRTGGDLRQHLMAVDPEVGRQMMMNALGLDTAYINAVNETERDLSKNRATLARLSKGYGPNNPVIVELQAAIQRGEHFVQNYQRRVQNQMADMQSKQLGPLLISLLQEDLNKVWMHETGLRDQYAKAEAAAVKFGDDVEMLAIVEREWKQLNELFDTLVDRINKIQIKEDSTDVRATVVTEAQAKRSPVSPLLLVVGFVSAVLGFGSGAIIVYIKDLVDDRFRSPEELRDQLGVDVLAMVRKLTPTAESGLEALQVHQAATAVESEAFRTLRTALALAQEDVQRVAVTSSEPGDGKTTVLANLAVSYAQAGRRTLMIDCDLRRPGLSKLLNMRRGDGVSQLLRSEEDVLTLAPQHVRSSGIEGLDVIPCGPKPSDPAELLSSGRLAELISWAETEYDQVLVDCPPMMAASDAAMVARLTDGVMLVVQPEKNHRRLVLRAVEHLRSMKVNLLGVVANRVSSEQDRGYYGYSYGYSYGYGYGHEAGYGAEFEFEDEGLESAVDETDREAFEDIPAGLPEPAPMTATVTEHEAEPEGVVLPEPATEVEYPTDAEIATESESKLATPEPDRAVVESESKPPAFEPRLTASASKETAPKIRRRVA